MNAPETIQNGATVVITHRVRDGKQAEYNNWLDVITPLCKAAPGHLDWQLIRPISGLTETYTVIIRFDTCDHLREWMHSQDRHRLIDQVRPLLALDDAYTIHSGFDFWFTPPNASVKVPVRWKQFLITWSAIYPLVLAVPFAIAPLLRPFGWQDNRFVATLFVTGTVVFLMAYVVMPRYTRLAARWLFK